MYKSTAQLTKLYFDPLIFEFYLVKNQSSKLDIFKLHNRLHPSEQNNGCFYPLMKIECSTPQLVVMSMNLTTSWGVEHSISIRG